VVGLSDITETGRDAPPVPDVYPGERTRIGLVEIVSFPETATPGGLRAQVLTMQRQAWPGGAPGHDPALRPLSMLLVDDGVVLAALDILFKEIVHAGRHWGAAGLSTVVTSREIRGHGYGTGLVTAARDRMMLTRGLDLGMFTCDRPLQRFYQSAGWQLLTGTVLIGGTPGAPFPSDQPGFDKVTMGDFFSAEARRQHGLFLGARIGLYPGEIDKLW
jgi:aminoglycoside 2'-N-acetyltransferase I